MHVPAVAGAATVSEATPLREGLLTGTLTGVNKLNYLDSGYSEEGDVDQHVTSCLMKTSSGSIYIPPSKSQCLKFIKKSHFIILRAKRATFIFTPIDDFWPFLSIEVNTDRPN